MEEVCRVAKAIKFLLLTIDAVEETAETLHSSTVISSFSQPFPAFTIGHVELGKKNPDSVQNDWLLKMSYHPAVTVASRHCSF